MFEHELKCRCSSSISPPRASQFFIPEAKPQFAPDRLVDVEHIKLELTVDLPSKTLKGTCTTDFRAVAPAVGKISFDATDLIVEQVFDASGGELRFDQQPKKLTVYLRKAPQPGEHGKVIIKYGVTEPRAGLYFIAPDKDYPNRPFQLWTQGQDQDNRYWIPCHDAPNEKAATEMLVTVDERYTAISNGKLMNAAHDKDRKTKTYHWKQAMPHASYLITLCVGEFTEMKEVWKDSRGHEIPVLYYTLAGRERETKLAFGKTPRMLEFYSKKIGVDYPYEKYAQVVAWDFIYGGMENTSATTQTEYTLHPESVELDYSSEPLVAHELAHQWFGDLLTCKEWSHAWLNEGFATYFEALWTEAEHGKDEFLYELFTNEKIYKAEDGGAYRRPIVTNIYLSPSDIFDRHLYEKGGRVLHMLRRLVGEDLWWKAINRYVMASFAKTVETVDLQRAFEETSGRALTWFFEQWVFKAGHPDFKANYEWVDDKKQVKLTLAQKQEYSALVGTFRTNVQFKIVTSDGEYIHDLDVTDVEQTYWFSCADKPKFVSLNPENTILGNWDFSPGRDLLISQLQFDKDVMGRVFAARTLAKDHSRQSVDALGEALGREKFWGVQLEIAETLGQIGSPRCQEHLLKYCAEIKHPKARKSAIKALGTFRNEGTLEVVERALKSDASPLVQYEAGVALGKVKASGIFEKLSAALGKRDSWHEYYDRGIIQGLAELKNDDRVLPLIMKSTRVGQSMFIRRDAVDALARFGQARPAVVIDALMDLTRDNNFFVRLLAVEALHRLGDDRAVPALKRVVDSIVEPRTHRAALLAMKGVRAGRSTPEDVEKLRTDFDRLRDDYRAMLGRLEKLETPQPVNSNS
ncbi:MAG: HEAT repeat domain-containing protein [Deltaproteobacteria bacterium]|nr:HEAT repeat domain-containing protein [Deltaproteobacteria bacterium]